MLRFSGSNASSTATLTTTPRPSNPGGAVVFDADYIIVDLMNDDSAYRQHGVTKARVDTHELTFSDSIFGSTGNIDADVLLMDYTLYFLTMI